MFKRSFVAMAGEANDALYHVPLVLAAGIFLPSGKR